LDVAQAEPIGPELLRPAQGVEAPKTQPSSSVSPAETEPATTENSPGVPSSTDQDNGFEFGSTPAPRFASERLSEHFSDHGSDFGATTEAEYEQQAAQFLTDDNPQILEFTRTKGYRQVDTVRFNPATDEFGAVTRDGTIRTYYRPNPEIHRFPTNLDYFNSEKEQSDE
jgi:hypothetical protein